MRFPPSLLLVGRRRSRRPPDAAHPFGHGKELYFWTLIVAVIFFAVGGGVSIYEGILHLIKPEPLRDPLLSYVVLGIAALFDGSSFIIVGERASEEVLRAVRDAANDGMIEFAECPLSMQLGPNEVLLGVTARFAPHLSANEVATAIQRFEDRLRKARPDVKYICVEPIPQQAQLSSPTPIAR